MNKITALDYKILITVFFLNENKDYPLSYGIFKILKGIKDEDTNRYEGLPTFSTLISITSKRVTFRCNSLLKLGLLDKIFVKENDEYYFCLTKKGEDVCNDFLLSHKIRFKKKEFKQISSIVHLPNFKN